MNLIVFNNSLYFENIALSLSKILAIELIDTIDVNNLQTHILFTIKDMKVMPVNYIVYNFEQLDTTINLSKQFYDRLYGAKHVFDYAQTNIKYLLTKDISATFLPYGWNSSMKISVRSYINRQNDILFLGFMNKRRRNILKPAYELCRDNNYNLFISNNCWDMEYKRMLRMSKIGINIHYYEGNTILEIHRIIPYILNKIYVITERSTDTYYDNLFDEMVTWMDKPLETLVHDALIMDNMEEILTFRQRKLIEKCSYNNEIKKLIGPYL